MTTDPIRFLDDPSAALELREFMLGQDRPDALPAGQRELIHRRIAASALALPVSLKLGGLLSQSASTAGGTTASGTASAAAGGATVTGGASGTVAAVASAKAGAGAMASGLAAGASVAPAAAAGGALATGGLTLAGAKGALVGLGGALSVTKGAAVLGVALATGAGATYVVKKVEPPEAALEADAGLPAGLPVARTSLRTGAPGEVSDRRGAVDCVEPPCEGSQGGPSPTEVGTLPAGEEQPLSLADLEDVEPSPGAGERPGRGTTSAAEAAREREASQRENATERLEEEVELLRRAQQLLRVDRGLAAAALERYDLKFPHGVMRAEYDVLRRRLLASPQP